MRVKSSLVPTVVALATALILACGEAATPAATPIPPPQSPTPTPISPETRQTATEFARSYQRISQDWDQFHSEFSQWRAGLTSCDRAAAEVALRGFAGEFNNVLRQARNLPRSSVTRELSDQLIEAAENEGESLRQLRDKWQPGNNSLFDQVEAQRSAAATAQKEVLDKLSDLRESTDPASVDEAREFSLAFEQVNEDWEQFHDSYSSLRDQQGDLSPADMRSQLSGLVEEFRGIVSAIGGLPDTDATDAMAEQLSEAADAEDEALKNLRDHFQGLAEAAEGEEGSNGDSTSSNGDDPFAALNGLVEDSDDVREQVQRDLENILEATSAQKITSIDNFRQQYDILVREWNSFHQDYDDWRNTEGGCDRTQVIQQLGQFSLRLDGIVREVRDLPRGSFVRPMADTLLEAAQREEEALRVLRNTWRPFATDVYRAWDQERSNAAQLRRQAEVGIQEMLERFNIPQSEI